MAQGPVKKLISERQRIRRYESNETLPGRTTSALLEWSSALHPNEPEYEYIGPDGVQKEFAIGTVQGYLREMRKVAERAFPDLLSVDPDAFNREMDAMNTGNNPDVQKGGLKQTSLMKTQSAARTFYWYFDITSPDDITVYGKPSKPMHNEDDLFTRKDIQSLRNHVEGPRNRALLEMLLNTGQRISAIQGLRICDVDIDQGSFNLNTEREGLKGAANRVQSRPLLGAKPFLAKWIDVHPFSDKPKSYVFIGSLDHHYTKPEEPLCQGTIRNMLVYTAERAKVDKPVNPHNFRHFWTTMMKQDYGLNDEEIKLLLGHKRESNGINNVYNHSITTKLLSNTERKFGRIDGTDRKPLTPDYCAVCDERLQPNWICCPVCGTIYGPSGTEPRS